MDENQQHLLTVQKVKAKFGRKTKFVGKVKPNYPKQSEREYEWVMSLVFKAFSKILVKRLPEIGQKFADFSMNDLQFNSDGNGYVSPQEQQKFLDEVNKLFDEIGDELGGSPELAKAIDKLDKMVQQNGKLTIAEWKREIKQTLAIDIYDDVFYGDEYCKLYQGWVDTNVDLIKTIPKNTLIQMKSIVADGYRNSSLGSDVAKQIQYAYNTSKEYAKFVARDQIAKMNAQITQEQHKQAGVTEYVWSAVHDSRVRERHAELDGQRFNYNNPPIVDERGGRRCNPGEDYQCRCCALPVFDLDTIKLPWEETREQREFDFPKNNAFRGLTKKFIAYPLINAKKSDIIKNRNIENFAGTVEDNPDVFIASVAGSNKMNDTPSGAIGDSGALPRNAFERMDKHAKMYYDEIRKRRTDIKAISENTGFSVEDIEHIKQHVFYNEYPLDGEGLKRFDPSYDMAVSWQRLIDGKNIQEMDIVLLNHELTELTIMQNQGLPYNEAHKITNKNYNYQKYLTELDRKEGIK